MESTTIQKAIVSNESTSLKGGLKSRHLSMISIAGVIGGALFVGSGKVIASAGPAAILAYLAGGLLVVLVMRMLGEMAVIVSSFFGFVAIFLTATAKMDIYDVLMSATGTVALYVYLAIAFSQLNMRRKLEAQGKLMTFKMWLFPWLTYLVIFIIIGSIIVMIFEGTYRNEVMYTSILAAVIVTMGVVAQRFNIGTKDKPATIPAEVV